jgi:hypothetical protein
MCMLMVNFKSNMYLKHLNDMDILYHSIAKGIVEVVLSYNNKISFNAITKQIL